MSYGEKLVHRIINVHCTEGEQTELIKATSIMEQAKQNGPNPILEARILKTSNAFRIFIYFRNYEYRNYSLTKDPESISLSQERFDLFAKKLIELDAFSEVLEFITLTNQLKWYRPNLIENYAYTVEDGVKRQRLFYKLQFSSYVDHIKLFDFYIREGGRNLIMNLSNVLRASKVDEGRLNWFLKLVLNAEVEENQKALFYFQAAKAIKEKHKHFSVAALGHAMLNVSGVSATTNAKRLEQFIKETGEDFDGQAAFL